VWALAVALTLPVAAALLPQPGLAQAARLAPERSLVPVRRPVLPEGLAGLRASETGILRPAAPPPRPGTVPSAQVPASMVPVVPPDASAAVAAALASDLPAFAADERPAFAAPGRDLAPVPDAPAITPAAEAAIGAAVGAALAASAPPTRSDRIAAAVAAALAPPPPPAATPVDPRAVARSPQPPPRSAAALRRYRTAAAARAAAPTTGARPTPAAVTRPPVATAPAGPGLCGVAGLQGRTLSRIGNPGRGCGIEAPVSLTHVHGIRLSTPATLHCDAARATGRWVRDVMVPAVGRQGGGIAEIRVAAHYACRGRNNQRGARLSEHARGRAIDISGYRLADGTRVNVLGDFRRGPHSSALRRMHAGACGIFRTTLGPGSDGFHEDHFHFDVAQHRGGGTYCR